MLEIYSAHWGKCVCMQPGRVWEMQGMKVVVLHVEWLTATVAAIGCANGSGLLSLSYHSDKYASYLLFLLFYSSLRST